MSAILWYLTGIFTAAWFFELRNNRKNKNEQNPQEEIYIQSSNRDGSERVY